MNRARWGCELHLLFIHPLPDCHFHREGNFSGYFFLCLKLVDWFLPVFPLLASRFLLLRFFAFLRFCFFAFRFPFSVFCCSAFLLVCCLFAFLLLCFSGSFQLSASLLFYLLFLAFLLVCCSLSVLFSFSGVLHVFFSKLLRLSASRLCLLFWVLSSLLFCLFGVHSASLLFLLFVSFVVYWFFWARSWRKQRRMPGSKDSRQKTKQSARARKQHHGSKPHKQMGAVPNDCGS